MPGTVRTRALVWSEWRVAIYGHWAAANKKQCKCSCKTVYSPDNVVQTMVPRRVRATTAPKIAVRGNETFVFALFRYFALSLFRSFPATEDPPRCSSLCGTHLPAAVRGVGTCAEGGCISLLGMQDLAPGKISA